MQEEATKFMQEAVETFLTRLLLQSFVFTRHVNRKTLTVSDVSTTIMEFKYERVALREWEKDNSLRKLKKEFEDITTPCLLRLTRRASVGRTANDLLLETKYLILLFLRNAFYKALAMPEQVRRKTISISDVTIGLGKLGEPTRRGWRSCDRGR